jgi:hypothetical protein
VDMTLRLRRSLDNAPRCPHAHSRHHSAEGKVQRSGLGLRQPHQQIIQLQLRRLPSVENCLGDLRREQRRQQPQEQNSVEKRVVEVTASA